jgi:hypothetical protein
VTHRVVLATRNPGKVTELRRILADVPGVDIELVGLDELPDVPEVAETGETFVDNALLKARAVSEATGLPASPTTAGCASTTSAAVPAYAARGGRASRATTSATWTWCSSRSPASTTPTAPRTSPAPPPPSYRAEGSGWPRDGWTGG